MNLLLAHIFRGIQLLFAILVLGLGADACYSWADSSAYAPSQAAFIVFCAVWTILVVFYFMLTPRFYEPAAHPIARFVVDCLTMLFWFAGFIALAVLVGAVAPFDANADYFNGYYYSGSHWYQVAAAATAFGAFEWALFVATTVISGLEAFNRGRGIDNRSAANPELQTSQV